MGKQEIKVFSDDMVAGVENPKEASKRRPVNLARL